MLWANHVHRTPGELLAAVTSADITEMMAFERIEPFGALHMEYMLGRVCATLVNVNLREDATPFDPTDFMPALRRAVAGYPDVIPPPPLSPEEASAAIDKAMFGRVLH